MIDTSETVITVVTGVDQTATREVVHLVVTLMMTEIEGTEVHINFIMMGNTQKRVLMQFAVNAGPDQPVHLHRLIWAFVVRLMNQW